MPPLPLTMPVGADPNHTLVIAWDPARRQLCILGPTGDLDRCFALLERARAVFYRQLATGGPITRVELPAGAHPPGRT